MFGLRLPWKSFNVDASAVNTWVCANAVQTTGVSADYDLVLWFTDEPDEATKQHINDYWTALTDQSTEATSYMSGQQFKDAVAAARLDATTKTWDQLSTAQKKLLAGVSPTRGDLGL